VAHFLRHGHLLKSHTLERVEMGIYVIGLFSQKSPIISGSFAKNDLQLKASFAQVAHFGKGGDDYGVARQRRSIARVAHLERWLHHVWTHSARWSIVPMIRRIDTLSVSQNVF